MNYVHNTRNRSFSDQTIQRGSYGNLISVYKLDVKKQIFLNFSEMNIFVLHTTQNNLSRLPRKIALATCAKSADYIPYTVPLLYYCR